MNTEILYNNEKDEQSLDDTNILKM